MDNHIFRLSAYQRKRVNLKENLSRYSELVNQQVEGMELNQKDTTVNSRHLPRTSNPIKRPAFTVKCMGGGIHGIPIEKLSFLVGICHFSYFAQENSL